MSLRFLVVIAGLLITTGCSSKDATAPAGTSSSGASPMSAVSPARATSPAPPAASAVIAKVDVCGLLTSDDLKKVQGEAYKEAKRSDRQDGDYIIAQCYYALPTLSNSVVLNVTTAKEGSGAKSPRVYWEQVYGKDEDKERSKEREKERDKKEKAQGRSGEEEEKGPPPEKIKGLGEEAFWLASPVGGALYVLKKDQFFRISVGGKGDAKSKLNKSKTLAEAVLKRL